MLREHPYIFIFSTLLCSVSCNAFATQLESYNPPPFSHYEPILERMPFGELPANFGQKVDPNAAKLAAQMKMDQEKLARRVNMSAVNITPQGETAIGFTDLSVKPPASYYLVVGDEAGGWKVNSADYKEEIAEIEKDGVTIALKLGKGLVKSKPTPSKFSGTRAPTKITIKKPVISGKTLTKSAIATSTPPTTTSKSASSIRDQLRNAHSSGSSGGDVRSYMERLRERKIKESTALLKAKERQRKQLEKLAREVASKEIKKQTKAMAEEAALEKEIALEEEHLKKAEAEEKPGL